MRAIVWTMEWNHRVRIVSIYSGEVNIILKASRCVDIMRRGYILVDILPLLWHRFNPKKLPADHCVRLPLICGTAGIGILDLAIVGTIEPNRAQVQASIRLSPTTAGFVCTPQTKQKPHRPHAKPSDPQNREFKMLKGHVEYFKCETGVGSEAV